MFKRGAFTLIEMMISITILSVMMLFLYKTHTTFNISNNNLQQELDTLVKMQKIRKIIYMDFVLARDKSIRIQNRDKNEDALFFQTSNSIHKRYDPHVAYKIKGKKLYRVESLKPIITYDFPIDSEFDIDCLGEVESFRVYQSLNKKQHTYVVHVDFKKFDDILFKIKVLN